MTSCAAYGYKPSVPCSEIPPKFKVVYRRTNGEVISEHPACFTHGMAEVERHEKSGGIARCDLEESK